MGADPCATGRCKSILNLRQERNPNLAYPSLNTSSFSRLNAYAILDLRRHLEFDRVEGGGGVSEWE